MKRSTVSTTELALDAAADLILENPPSAPATPSISNLCKAVGIGASTFYRLYQNSDEFRHALAVYSILDSYEPGRQAVAEALETTTLETTAPEPATIAPEPSAAAPWRRPPLKRIERHF